MQEQLNQIEEKLIKLNNQTKKASKEWRYILLNLNLRNKTIDDLKDIFGVSQTAINKWKNGEPIARDKKIFLAKMFGVTLDEYYENKCADDLYNSLVYNLEQIINIQDYKNLTYYKNIPVDLMSGSKVVQLFYQQDLPEGCQPR